VHSWRARDRAGSAVLRLRRRGNETHRSELGTHRARRARPDPDAGSAPRQGPRRAPRIAGSEPLPRTARTIRVDFITAYRTLHPRCSSHLPDRAAPCDRDAAVVEHPGSLLNFRPLYLSYLMHRLESASLRDTHPSSHGTRSHSLSRWRSERSPGVRRRLIVVSDPRPLVPNDDEIGLCKDACKRGVEIF
jgi:hypothetical protein